MNLQEIQALPLAASTQEVMAADVKFAQPVTLTEAEIAEALQKADNKSANVQHAAPLPEEEQARQLILELVALNREIELTEAKYRKAVDEENQTLAARITTLQNHKTKLSTLFVTNLCN